MSIEHNTFATTLSPLPDLDTSGIEFNKEDLNDIQQVTYLLSLGQILCGQLHGGVSRLCREIRAITQDRAQICLGRQKAFKRVQLPPATILTLPVQFKHHVYGVLCITSDPLNPEQPAIASPVAQLLAQACSWLLFTLEQAAFVQGQCQHLDYQMDGPLTKREQEVLSLMCQGYNQDAIANLLHIAPATVGKHRQHIYEQLGVHNERDALLAAYHSGLFSLIDDIAD
ncbi:MAG TPA: helix-turn-helix transcriptional regulator [Ktedonobacteraceae bacterium]|nr:helix-turn-helix transcriptional regulator [Ktedonobacteraceae bacterium]